MLIIVHSGHERPVYLPHWSVSAIKNQCQILLSLKFELHVVNYRPYMFLTLDWGHKINGRYLKAPHGPPNQPEAIVTRLVCSLKGIVFTKTFNFC